MWAKELDAGASQEGVSRHKILPEGASRARPAAETRENPENPSHTIQKKEKRKKIQIHKQAKNMNGTKSSVKVVQPWIQERLENLVHAINRKMKLDDDFYIFSEKKFKGKGLCIVSHEYSEKEPYIRVSDGLVSIDVILPKRSEKTLWKIGQVVLMREFVFVCCKYDDDLPLEKTPAFCSFKDYSIYLYCKKHETVQDSFNGTSEGDLRRELVVNPNIVQIGFPEVKQLMEFLKVLQGELRDMLLNAQKEAVASVEDNTVPPVDMTVPIAEMAMSAKSLTELASQELERRRTRRKPTSSVAVEQVVEKSKGEIEKQQAPDVVAEKKIKQATKKSSQELQSQDQRGEWVDSFGDEKKIKQATKKSSQGIAISRSTRRVGGFFRRCSGNDGTIQMLDLYGWKTQRKRHLSRK